MKLTKQQEDKINQTTILCSKMLFKVMELNNIPNFIETIVVDDITGFIYKLRFEKLK